jgi:hypothetical protein
MKPIVTDNAGQEAIATRGNAAPIDIHRESQLRGGAAGTAPFPKLASAFCAT